MFIDMEETLKTRHRIHKFLQIGYSQILANRVSKSPEKWETR